MDNNSNFLDLIRSSKAFTLVELAIVITIIGLLIASVTAGTALVKQSKIRSVISEIQELKSAVDTFRNTYDYLPGDFPHASFHWGVQACRAQGANATYGANGDGDDQVHAVHSNPTAVPGKRDAIDEIFASWCHLYMAGLIKHETIVMQNKWAPSWDDPGKIASIPGKYLPASKFGKGSAYILASFMTQYPLDRSNSMHPTNITLSIPGLPLWNSDPALTPKQAYAIDKKVDDGKPNTGLYRVSENTNADCVVSGQNRYNILGSARNEAHCTLAVIVQDELL